MLGTPIMELQMLNIPEIEFPVMEFSMMEIEDSANDQMGELDSSIETY